MSKKFSIFNFQFAKKFKNSTFQCGFTLIELLVALSIFVIIGLFATQTLTTILLNRQKAEVTRQVRQEADYALGVIGRHLRGATSVANCSGTAISYFDFYGKAGGFSCILGGDSYVASSGARLTSDKISVSSCQFTCTPPASPTKIDVSLTLTQRTAATDPREKASISVSSQVILRNQ